MHGQALQDEQILEKGRAIFSLESCWRKGTYEGRGEKW
jgi:hypothetical protein